jgi:DHA2 family multidrug resistance protein
LRTQATGIYSLMRNIGSAIGISVTGALLQSNTQINHADIADGVTPFNRALHAARILRFWDPAQVHGATALNVEVTRQASIIAYIDDFKLMLILAIATLPFILLIRSKATAAAAGDHGAVMD